MIRIEWGTKRSELETFDYAARDLALCDRHVGEWVGLMNVPHLQLAISDAALMAPVMNRMARSHCALAASRNLQG